MLKRKRMIGNIKDFSRSIKEKQRNIKKEAIRISDFLRSSTRMASYELIVSNGMYLFCTNT